MKEKYIHGHKVYYEENAGGGADYLSNHLDDAEARVFFDQARSKGHIKFEDSMGKDYTFSRNGDGSYTIEHKS